MLNLNKNRTIMKSRLFILGILFAFFSTAAIAQDATEEQITDEELTRYAVAMDSVERMKATLMAKITDKVENNDLMVNSRYNELTKIIDEEAQLAAAKATPEEIAFVKEIGVMKDEGASVIKETLIAMVKEDVTAATYNRVTKALKSDPEVKKRYDAIFTTISATEEQIN